MAGWPETVLVVAYGENKDYGTGRSDDVSDDTKYDTSDDRIVSV